eukprot:TRINITY_DN3374_c0_g1_i2.p1 TRINITY_DN3374_c0_g1~~TRINITY_DN3374_c0_g1_i2.p1  ORF type:complete len:185 (-),score=29.62 TRINITY_DN3374_c0_g1_i2:583-1137(-)
MEQEEVAEQQAPTQTLLQDLAQAEKRLTTLQQQPNKDKQQIADVRECVRFRRQLVLEQEKTRRARIKASLRAENPKKRRLALSGATEGALSSVLATLEIRTPMITPNLVDVPRAFFLPFPWSDAQWVNPELEASPGLIQLLTHSLEKFDLIGKTQFRVHLFVLANLAASHTGVGRARHQQLFGL